MTFRTLLCLSCGDTAPPAGSGRNCAPSDFQLSSDSFNSTQAFLFLSFPPWITSSLSLLLSSQLSVVDKNSRGLWEGLSPAWWQEVEPLHIKIKTKCLRFKKLRSLNPVFMVFFTLWTSVKTCHSIQLYWYTYRLKGFSAYNKT